MKKKKVLHSAGWWSHHGSNSNTIRLTSDTHGFFCTSSRSMHNETKRDFTCLPLTSVTSTIVPGVSVHWIGESSGSPDRTVAPLRPVTLYCSGKRFYEQERNDDGVSAFASPE